MTWLSEMSGMASSGVRSVAMTPATMSTAYATRTMNRFRAESSISLRIMSVSLVRVCGSGRSRGRGRPRATGRRTSQLRFGVEKETTFDDDLLAAVEAGPDHDRLAVTLTDRDFARLIRVGRSLDPDELSLAAVDHNGLRDHDVRRRRWTDDPRADVHVRLEPQVRIGQLDADASRACFTGEERLDERDHTRKADTRDGGRRDRDGLTDVDSRKLLLVDVGFNPDDGEVDDLEERLSLFDVLLRNHEFFRNDSGDRRHHRRRVQRLSTSFELTDLSIGHPEQDEPAPC